MTREIHGRWFAIGIIVIATSFAYLSSFRGALVFDDIPGIANNPTIRELGRFDLLRLAMGPQGGTLSGRPVPNFTLALNYAISGDALWSYHLANLTIHLLAALALFGVVRRTLMRPLLAAQFGSRTGVLALAIAVLWSLHPLQTESVTYLVQRVESLMGLCYLLTLYCFIRAIDAAYPKRWYVAAGAACFLGMGCKEVMATAPLLVCLYDRIFVGGSWREVGRRHGWFHAALASSWLLLGWLVLESGGRGGTAGYGAGIEWWRYSLTQCHVVLSYLKLTFWPHPLIFDHNLRLVENFQAVWLQALALLALLGVTAGLLWRRPAAGFAAGAFFAILAPTSSIVPVADAMVEHRMYLPVAAVLTLLVLGLELGLGRRAIPLFAIAALAFGIATARRNLDYRSPEGLWSDTVRKAPKSARAHNNLGAYHLNSRRLDAAQERFTAALRLDPKYASAHYNLGQLREKTGDLAGAIEPYETALRLNPKLTDARVNLGNLFDRLGRTAEAVSHYEAALEQEPQAADVHAFLGAALLKLRRAPAAIPHLQLALELEPERADVWCNLARAHQLQNNLSAARQAGERALQLRPGFPEALYVLGNLDAAAGDFVTAIARFRRAVEAAPDYIAARNNLANALLMIGQSDAAIAQYRIILRDRPNDRAVEENLSRALEMQRAAPSR